MFVMLSIIVLVAVFNILSSLIMLVRAKTRDIAILRTMGATRREPAEASSSRSGLRSARWACWPAWRSASSSCFSARRIVNGVQLLTGQQICGIPRSVS